MVDGEPLDVLRVARLEEGRQAVGVAEVSREARPLSGGWVCYGGPGSWQNQAVGLALNGPIGVDELDALVAFYAERDARAEVLVCPFAHPTLRVGLAERGFAFAGFDQVFARSLRAPLVSAPTPDGLTIREVRRDDVRDVDAWLDVHLIGERLAGEPAPPVLVEASRRVLDHPRITALVAEHGGVVVGACALEIAGPLAALMAAGVLPAHRRRGIQRALIAHRLQRAQCAGAELATIQCFPGIVTERNARRLGFELAYMRAELVS